MVGRAGGQGVCEGLSCNIQKETFACGQKETFEGLAGILGSQNYREKWIFRFGTGTGRACQAAVATAQPAVCQALSGAQVASPQSPILRQSGQG